MFSGVGGFETAYQKLGWQTIGLSEIDKHASRVLKYRFPEVKNYGDATRIIPEEMPDFELLVGGFPCQAFSIAGKRKGLGDPRGTLFAEIVRIVSVKKPRILLLENVAGLLSHDSGRTLNTIFHALAGVGYILQWQVINGKGWVPQNRERIFIVGYLGKGCFRKIFPISESNGTANVSEKIKHNLTAQDQHEVLIQVGNIDTAGHNSQWGRVYNPDGIASTLMGAKTGLYEIKHRIRRLTPTERERLMTWPDDWTRWGIDDKGNKVNQRYKMCGNGVISAVVESICQAIQKTEED